MVKTSTVALNGMKNVFVQNWAENYSCTPALYFEPNTVEELKEIIEIAKANQKRITCVGCRHSPSDILCTNDYMVSMKKLDHIIEVDTEKMQIKCEGGTNIEKINKVLEDNRMALSILGSISCQTIAGAISTGHHASGKTFGILSDYVLEVDILLANGEIKTYSNEENSDEFKAVVQSLGALGVILTVKIQCEPAFNLEYTHYSRKLDEVLNSLDTYINSAEHFQLNWFPHTDYVQCVQFNRTKKPKTTNKPSILSWIFDMLIGYYLYEFGYFLGIYIPSIIPYVNWIFFKLFCANRKTFVDVSYNVFNVICLMKQHASESSVAVKDAPRFILKLKKWLEDNPHVKAHNSMQIRFARPDNIWLSPAYQRDACYISIAMFIPFGYDVERSEYWKAYQDLLQEFQGRPHWAKEHNYTAKDLEKVYPRFNDFMKLKNKLDPNGLFMNEYLERHLVA